MGRRDLAAEDEDTVCIWVCRVRSDGSEIGARADRKLAQAWVERRVDGDGVWHGSRGKRIFQTQTAESGCIELVSLPNVYGMVIQDM